MVNVTFEAPYGRFTETQRTSEGVRKYEILICKANCLCTMVHFAGERAQLIGFFNSARDASEALRRGAMDAWDDFRLDASQMDPGMRRFAKILAGGGKKVAIE